MADTSERTLIESGTDSSNDGPHRKDRLLALDIRPRRLGFVAFEGPTRLLDWGVRSYGGTENELSAVVVKRIDTLLNLYTPSTIVVQRRRSPTEKAGKTTGIVVRTIRVEAARYSIKFKFVTRLTVRHFFIQYGAATKHQIASILAKWFKDLAWKLPPRRKPWQSENHNMVIFDAAALGVVFYGEKHAPKEPVAK